MAQWWKVSTMTQSGFLPSSEHVDPKNSKKGVVSPSKAFRWSSNFFVRDVIGELSTVGEAIDAREQQLHEVNAWRCGGVDRVGG